LFLKPGEDVVAVRDGADVVEALRVLGPADTARIGRAGRQRVLAEHTYDRRAVELDRVLTEALALRRSGSDA
jgi:spore maturation protein CgeB